LAYTYKRHRLKVFICGNYDENSHERGQFLKIHKQKPKLNYFFDILKTRTLKNWERLLFIEAMIKNSNDDVLENPRFDSTFGLTHQKGVRNTYHRVVELMGEAELIIILLTNTGGAVVEHTLSICEGHQDKTINFVEKDTMLSGMMTSGTFMLPSVKVVTFTDEEDLFEKIKKYLDTYKKELSLKEVIKKNPKVSRKLTLFHLINRFIS